MEEMFNYIRNFKNINKDELYEQTVKSQMTRMYKVRNLCMEYEIRHTIFELFSEMLEKEYPKIPRCDDKITLELDKLIRNKKFEMFEEKLKNV